MKFTAVMIFKPTKYLVTIKGSTDFTGKVTTSRGLFFNCDCGIDYGDHFRDHVRADHQGRLTNRLVGQYRNAQRDLEKGLYE